MVRTVGNYLLYHTIGVGSYGRVKYAVNKTSGEAVAIKVSIALMLRNIAGLKSSLTLADAPRQSHRC